MESLVGYSSGDSSDSETPLNSLLETIPFSQNYSHQHHMSNIYLQIPWKPMFSSVKVLKSISSRALKYLELNHNKFYSSYDWNIIGDPSRKRVSLMDPLFNHHISLIDNMNGTPDSVDKFESDICNAVALMNINSSLILERKDFNGDSINNITFKFENTLKIFPSASSSSVFISAVISMEGPSKEFFGQLEEITNDLAQIHGLRLTSISGTNNEKFKEENTGPIVRTFHVSLVKSSERILYTETPIHEELLPINETLKSVEFPELSELPIDINTIEINKTTHKRSSTTLRLLR